MGSRGTKPRPGYDRIMERIVVTASGCWEWTGSVDRGGYGQVYLRDGTMRRINRKAHRIVWEHEHGPLDPGCDLHHECRNRRCVNPAHLTPTDHREHAEHHLSASCRACGAADWYVRRDNGSRQCRECRNRRRLK